LFLIVMEKMMGLVIKAAGCAGGVVDWHSGENEELLYCRADSALDLCAHCPLYCASERGIEALRATIVFGMWSIIPYFLYLLSLWYFTGFLRLPLALGGLWSAGASAPGYDLLLEPLSLAQRAAAVHGKGSAGDVAAGEQVIDKVDHLFSLGRFSSAIYSAPAGDTPHHRFR
jgi:hypothetical protein